MSGIVWAQPVPWEPIFTFGGLYRWRDAKSHRWNYGIYRGAENGAFLFSKSRIGPIVQWLGYFPKYVEVAEVES